MAIGRNEERWQYWRRVLEEHRASGQSIAEFCRERKLSQASFYSWRLKLGSSSTDRASKNPSSSSSSSSRPLFVSVPLPDSVPPAGHFEVQLPNGIRVRVPPQFDGVVLASLLQTASGIENEYA
jgi:hypothetical protein